MQKKVTVIIKDPQNQYEGLRTSLGLLLEDTDVTMFVLNHEIANMDEAYSDNLGFLDEMEGAFYSNNSENITKYGFSEGTVSDLAEMIHQSDIVIPF